MSYILKAIEQDGAAIISADTLRTSDLFVKFADVLRDMTGKELRKEIETLYAFAQDEPENFRSLADYSNDQSVSTFVMEMNHDLEEAAPDGYVFSTHPGDGALFGFWPVEEKEAEMSYLRAEKASGQDNEGIITEVYLLEEDRPDLDAQPMELLGIYSSFERGLFEHGIAPSEVFRIGDDVWTTKFRNVTFYITRHELKG